MYICTRCTYIQTVHSCISTGRLECNAGCEWIANVILVGLYLYTSAVCCVLREPAATVAVNWISTPAAAVSCCARSQSCTQQFALCIIPTWPHTCRMRRICMCCMPLGARCILLARLTLLANITFRWHSWLQDAYYFLHCVHWVVYGLFSCDVP